MKSHKQPIHEDLESIEKFYQKNPELNTHTPMKNQETKEEYCEPTDTVYTSNPAQYKCKKCGQMWYETQLRPKCLSNKLPNKEEKRCTGSVPKRTEDMDICDDVNCPRHSVSPSDKTWSDRFDEKFIGTEYHPHIGKVLYTAEDMVREMLHVKDFIQSELTSVKKREMEIRDKMREVHQEQLTSATIKAKRDLLEEINNHEFNVFKADTALMLGSEKLSTIKSDEVIDVQELKEYIEALNINLEEPNK